MTCWGISGQCYGWHCRELACLSIVCLLQITQELREYAQQHQIDEEEAAQVSMSYFSHLLKIATCMYKSLEAIPPA